MTPEATTKDDCSMETRISDQTEWLADNTAMSERQAETLVRDTIRGDAPQRQVAECLGISESTVSNHLAAASDATDDSTSAVPYWLFFGPGPLDPAAYQMTPIWTNGGSERVVIFENQFPKYTNRHGPQYYVVHQYPDRDNNDELPDHVQANLADARIRHVTDRYEFDTLRDLQRALAEVVTFDSDRKREQFEDTLEAYCQAKRVD